MACPPAVGSSRKKVSIEVLKTEKKGMGRDATYYPEDSEMEERTAFGNCCCSGIRRPLRW